LTFIYKILDVIFIAINKGLDERILVNMDRWTKVEKEFVTITCSAYYIMKILNIMTVE
jgi:hypothetical protein